MQFAKVATIVRQSLWRPALVAVYISWWKVNFVSIVSQYNSIPRLAESTFQCCTNIISTTCRTSALPTSYFNLPYLAQPPFSFQPEGCSHNFPPRTGPERAWAYLYLYSFSLLCPWIQSLLITSNLLHVDKYSNSNIFASTSSCGPCTSF